MLLLVLILVLVAFGLLVVALVQGSVLWAWLSVAISVAAASALLFDWWQRQQALRDEEAPPPAPVPDRPQAVSADTDSVTEFIPVVGRQEPAQQEEETRFLPKEPSGSVPPPVASEQTVVLPVARPPGSTDQPPGATPAAPPWGASPSQSVTDSGSVPPSESARPESGGADQAGEETVLQPVEGRATDTPQRSNGVPVGEAQPSQAPPAEQRAVGGLFTAPAGEDATSAVPVQPAQPPRQPAGEAAEEPTRADVQANDQEATQLAPAQPPQQEPEQPGPPAGAEADPAATEAAMPALPPAGPDGEPPEERLVPAAAQIAAAAEDEVVVVDERPRYHLEGCPFLPGRPVIPLPVREAVELGFTPCGWCEPNRKVADRHQPAAR